MDALTKITVAGFKSLVEERCVDIRPLTILAGANSSGKSSLLQPLLLMKQTLESPFDPGPLLLKGSNAGFAAANQFLSFLNGACVDELVVEFETRSGRVARNTFLKEASEPLSLNESSYQIPGSGTRLQVPKGGEISFAELKQFLSGSEYLADLVPTGPTRRLRRGLYEVKRHRCFLGFSEIELPVLNSLTALLTSLVHVPALRDTPQRTYPRSSVHIRPTRLEE